MNIFNHVLWYEQTGSKQTDLNLTNLKCTSFYRFLVYLESDIFQKNSSFNEEFSYELSDSSKMIHYLKGSDSSSVTGRTLRADINH